MPYQIVIDLPMLMGHPNTLHQQSDCVVVDVFLTRNIAVIWGEFNHSPGIAIIAYGQLIDVFENVKLTCYFCNLLWFNEMIFIERRNFFVREITLELFWALLTWPTIASVFEFQTFFNTKLCAAWILKRVHCIFR